MQQLTPTETLTETYNYTLTDKDGDTSSANLVITITGTDDLPVAVADTAGILEDAVDVTGNVISNDTLGDGTVAENQSTLNTSTNTYGTLVLNLDGSYTYTLDNSNPLVQQLAPTDTLTDGGSSTPRFGVLALRGQTASVPQMPMGITGALVALAIRATPRLALSMGSKNASPPSAPGSSTAGFSRTSGPRASALPPRRTAAVSPRPSSPTWGRCGRPSTPPTRGAPTSSSL